MGWKIESGVRCPWESDSSTGFTGHPPPLSLAFFASPCGSLNDFSRHASSVPELSALCRPEHAGISKQWNLWAEIEFITTLPAQIASLNGAAIRAMGFDFQVFYWSTFWIRPPPSSPAPLQPHPHCSPLPHTNIRFNACGCVHVWMYGRACRVVGGGVCAFAQACLRACASS